MEVLIILIIQNEHDSQLKYLNVVLVNQFVNLINYK